ncbi:universal stress protein [Shinella daejeonensis]|uniref:universal stress protein n=1 Tax=Shinella daejeonensis TaxID=659017 RepID=UPI0020C831AF|nr:universal stress protein [Shinella daejeonensis]MCP8894283.1 universal stress protein [Shinella daejeonensis]
MYTHILISTDGSELAEKGVDHGLSLAKALDSKVTIVTVTEPFPAPVGRAGWVITPNDIARYGEEQKKEAEELLSSIKSRADKMGIDAATVHVPNDKAAPAILETARQAECNLIVMASHGRRGVSRLLLGSQTAEVVSSSPVPVLVVR